MANDSARQIVAPPTPMKITQIAVVVRDIEAALKTYTQTLGWGPWSVFDYKPPLLHDTRVKGEPVDRGLGADHPVLHRLALDPRVVQQRGLVVKDAPRAPAQGLRVGL